MQKMIIVFLLLSSFVFGAIDINTATFDELVSLKGIGKKKANKILQYRKKHKCFKDLKEFKKVKGIKKKTIKKNKNNLVVGECNK